MTQAKSVVWVVSATHPHVEILSRCPGFEHRFEVDTSKSREKRLRHGTGNSDQILPPHHVEQAAGFRGSVGHAVDRYQGHSEDEHAKCPPLQGIAQ